MHPRSSRAVRAFLLLSGIIGTSAMLAGLLLVRVLAAPLPDPAVNTPPILLYTLIALPVMHALLP